MEINIIKTKDYFQIGYDYIKENNKYASVIKCDTIVILNYDGIFCLYYINSRDCKGVCTNSIAVSCKEILKLIEHSLKVIYQGNFCEDFIDIEIKLEMPELPKEIVKDFMKMCYKEEN